MIKKEYTLFFIALSLLVVFYLLGYYQPFVNDLYTLQLNSLKNGNFHIASVKDKLFIFDATLHGEHVFMSWGLWPAIEYFILDVFSFGHIPNSVIYYLHLLGILLIIKKYGPDNKLFFFASPLFMSLLQEDVSAQQVAYVLGLSYLLLGLYFKERKSLYGAELFCYFLALHCRFGFFPVVLFLCLLSFVSTKKIKYVIFPLFGFATLLLVNYLKFNNPFYFGETFNKLQGEWLTIFKTLQLDSYSLARLAYSLRDFLLGVFFNFDSEKMWGISYTISQVNSLYIWLAVFAIPTFFRIKVKNKVLIIVGLFELLFLMFFVRFYSHRLILLPVILFLLGLEFKERHKYSVIATSFLFLISSILLIDFERRFYTRPLELRNEVYHFDGYGKRSLSCDEFRSYSSSLPTQVIDSVFTGFKVKESTCGMSYVSSMLMNKSGQNCRLSIYDVNVDCALFNVNVLGQNISASKSDKVCNFLISNSYVGELIMYFIVGFDQNFLSKDVMEKDKELGLINFSKIDLECDE